MPTTESWLDADLQLRHARLLTNWLWPINGVTGTWQTADSCGTTKRISKLSIVAEPQEGCPSLVAKVAQPVQSNELTIMYWPSIADRRPVACPRKADVLDPFKSDTRGLKVCSSLSALGFQI